MSEFRIVSLCPSTTLTIFDLGLEESLVARTIFCNKPEDRVNLINRVGGTKNPKFDRIKGLKPSHILFNMEENEANHLSDMQAIAKTVVTTPIDINSTLEMIEIFGKEFNRMTEARRWIELIETKRNEILQQNYEPFKYYYFIWREPHMLAGGDTYIDHLLSLFGGINAAKELSDERYITLTKEELESVKVDKILLSSEPFPFKEKHFAEFDFLNSHIQLIDGEAASWHGTYTFNGLSYLADFF